MVLSLDPHVNRFLISTPSRLVGELNTPTLRLQFMFPENPAEFETSLSAGPYSRDYCMISARTPDNSSEPGDFAVPTTTLQNEEKIYHHNIVATMVTDLASIWFGKRFDYHGALFLHGVARLPDLSSSIPINHRDLAPYNHLLRSDLAIKLSLDSLTPVLCFLFKRQPEEELATFWTATRFYARALRAFDTDPEAAFFHLIVALEVIASKTSVPDDDLYDELAKEELEAIKILDDNIQRRIRSRYYQLGRRVVYATEEFTNDVFFDGSQARQGMRLNRNNLEKCVKAAYNLRSKYAHAGASFGIWLTGFRDAEIQVGRPILPDSQEKELEEILANIPTFAGLERLVRFIILSFGHRRIEAIDERLQKSNDG